MKPTENYEQLRERFEKRKEQLKQRLRDNEEAHDIYVRTVDDLDRLEGSLQVIDYLQHCILPNDGNHDGMENHQPT